MKGIKNEKRKARLFLVLCLCVVVVGSAWSFDPVRAFIDTATATWNIRTPPPTPEGTPNVGNLFPTITATLNSSCPVGTIVGYGTTTPGLNWLLTCGQCLPDGTSTPTFDFNSVYLTNAGGGTATSTATPGSATPSPTVTITPTVTATPPAGLISCGTLRDGVTCEEVGNGVRFDIDITVIHNEVSSTPQFHFSVDSSLFFQPMYISYNLTSEFSDPTIPYSGWDRSLVMAVHDTFSQNIVVVNGPTSDDTQHSEGTATRDFGNPDMTVYIGATGSNEDTTRYHGFIIFSGNPIVFTPTPTVAITSTIDPNYCSSIDGSEYSYESWFQLIGLTGSSKCFPTPYISASDYFGSGWTAFFSFLFPQEVVDFIAEAVIPAQTWCFYGFGFTRLQLFSILLDPTVFADMGIVLFVIAHFLNK